MLIRFAKFLIVFLLILEGCMPIPSHELAEKEGACSCETVATEALATGEFEAGDWPEKDWWNRFNDPILTSLIEEALRINPTLMKAEENLKMAYQNALQARSRLFPQIFLDGDSNWQHLARDGFFRAYAPVIPSIVNDIHLGFSYYYEFDFWGKNRDLFRSALGEASAMAAEAMQAELIITTSIAYTYAELQLLLQKKNLLEQIENNDALIQAFRGQREKHALDPAITYLQSESRTLDSQAPLYEIGQQIQTHFHKIKALTGLGQDASIEIPAQAQPQLQVAIPNSLSLDLIARRPDLIAQKWRVEAAAKQIGAAKTDFYPNINIAGFLGLESIFWSTLFQRKNYSGNMDPAFHLPIFTGGRIRANLREKVAEFNAAVYEYNDLILKAAQEIADTLSDLYRLQKEIELRQDSLRVAEKQAWLTGKRVEHALDDQITFLQRQNEVLVAEIALVELEYGKVLSSIQLIRNLGGGYYCD